MKINFILTLVTTLLFTSCTNSAESDETSDEIENIRIEDSKDISPVEENELDSDEVEGIIAEAIETVEKTQRESNNPTINEFRDMYPETKYYFLVLEVFENKLDRNQKSYYTTSIQSASITELNEDFKYKLLDELVSNYKNSTSGRIYNGSIISRDIFIHNSYQSASKARETYIME